jgi:hypothetical protein
VNQDPGAAVTNLYVSKSALGPTPLLVKAK